VFAGFLLFRLLDIAKPWPISWADSRVGGGLGIMLDDLLAGALVWASFAAVRPLIGA
jgi:phosphatidylglycerophosphatase A